MNRLAAAALLCLLGTAAAAGTKTSGAKMETLKTVTEPVASVNDPAGEADGTLELTDGTRCTLSRQDKRYTVWVSLLRGAHKSGTPVYVSCAPNGGAADTILPMAARRIEMVGEAAGEKAPVHILMAPSVHFLSTKNPDYATLRGRLEEAIKSGEPILLAIEPRSLEILAARKPAEGAKVTPI